jgi:hypothetical protein
VKLLAVALAAAAALALASSAAAKEFAPGSVLLCRADACAPIEEQAVLDVLSELYYGTSALVPVSAAPSGDLLELRFDNGYVSGVVGPATAPDRFQSGGVNLDRFADGQWYELPAPLAQGLAALAGRSGLESGGPGAEAAEPQAAEEAGAEAAAERPASSSSRWPALVAALGGLGLALAAIAARGCLRLRRRRLT